MSARKTLLLIGEDGHGKRVLTSELKPKKHRGGIGVTVSTSPPLAAALMVRDSDELIVATRQGQIIRLAVDDVPIYHREARGVRVVRLRQATRSLPLRIAQEVTN